MVPGELDVMGLLEDLVAIPSVNPEMDGGSGEKEIVDRVASILGSMSLDVSTPEVQAGRCNVLGRLEGDQAIGSILFEAHLDTVSMPRQGPTPNRTGERLFGRGSCDAKGSAAAMIAALDRLRTVDHRPTVIFAGVVDEEFAMAGSRALVDQLGAPPEVAVVGEPTSLHPVRVHNGLARMRIEIHGRTAHTSKAHLGLNAISGAARVVLALTDELYPRLLERGHPMVGPALVTPAVIRGGVAANVVPDHCILLVDRRLAPGEDSTSALQEIDRLIDRLRGEGVVATRHDPDILLPAVETPDGALVVRIAEGAVEKVLKTRLLAEGAAFGTDASNLWGVGGIPCVVLGPGSIDQAHTEDEWVSTDEVLAATKIYVEMARSFGTAVK